jgi:hypothetical protein
VDLDLGMLVNLEDLVGNQAVSLAMNCCSVLRRVGSTRQKILPAISSTQ